MPPVAPAGETDDIVFGIPVRSIDGGKLTRAVRLVICISVISIILKVIDFSFRMLSGVLYSSLYSSFLTLVVQLTIPACGYYGALKSNHHLMLCFCGCNLISTIILLFDIVLARIQLVSSDGNCGFEEPGSRQHQLCELWTVSSTSTYFAWAMFVLSGVVGCSAFYWGNKLYQRINRDMEIVTVAYQAYSDSTIIPVQPRVIGIGSETHAGSNGTIRRSTTNVFMLAQNSDERETLTVQNSHSPHIITRGREFPTVVIASTIGNPTEAPTRYVAQDPLMFEV